VRPAKPEIDGLSGDVVAEHLDCIEHARDDRTSISRPELGRTISDRIEAARVGAEHPARRPSPQGRRDGSLGGHRSGGIQVHDGSADRSSATSHVDADPLGTDPAHRILKAEAIGPQEARGQLVEIVHAEK